MKSHPKRSRARACANIALAKYWGKADLTHNLPAVPSISLTLKELWTETSVDFSPELRADRFVLDGLEASAAETARVSETLDGLRKAVGFEGCAEVCSRNNFPTAAGLASSASGFAALVVAAADALGIQWHPSRLSAVARRASASAARSLFGGFVELRKGAPGEIDLGASPIVSADYWPLRMVIAITHKGRKTVGSTEGMERSRQTSPLYDSWLRVAPQVTQRIRLGIFKRDLEEVGTAMEQSTVAFHACAMSAVPPIAYWQPTTLACLHAVHALRGQGIGVWATMDAGPHVKALCAADDAEGVATALQEVSGVEAVSIASPGDEATVVREEREG